MAIVRKNKTLIGFEEGVSIRSYEQLVQQTRSRFFPLARPEIKYLFKNKTHASVVIPITKIPSDPGDGKYTLVIEDYEGNTLKIRASQNIKATSSLTVVNKDSWTNSMSFKLVDNEKTITFTCNTSSNSALRTSEANYSFGLSGANSTTLVAQRIFNAINLAYEREELNIKPTFSAGSSVVNLEQVSFGNRGNTPITITNATAKLTASNGGKFSGGTFGLPRRENGNFVSSTGTINSRAYHPKDSTAFALQTRGTENVKQVTFDLNKIINNSGYAIKSKIIQDDVLLIYQNIKGGDGLLYGNRASPGTSATQSGLNDQAIKYNFRFDTKNLSGELLEDTKFSDIPFERDATLSKKYIDLEVGGINVDFFMQSATGVDLTLDSNAVFSNWFKFENVNFSPREDTFEARILKFKLDLKIPQGIIDSADLIDQAPYEIMIIITACNYPIRRENPFPAYSIDLERDSAKRRLTYNAYINSAQSVLTEHNSNNVKTNLRIKRLIADISKVLEKISNQLKLVKISLVPRTLGLPRPANVSTNNYVIRIEQSNQQDITHLNFKLYNGIEQISFSAANYLTGSSSSMVGYELIDKAQISLKDFYDYPIYKPAQRALGSFTILNGNTAKWTNTTHVTLSGSQKAVKFIADPSAAADTFTKIDSNNYKFGVSNVTGPHSHNKKQILSSIAGAIKAASDNNDLDISLFDGNMNNAFSKFQSANSNDLDSLKLRQHDYDEKTNTEIKVYPPDALEATNFVGGVSRLKNITSFREDADVFIKKMPSHNIEIRSFGTGDNIDSFNPFRDLSFHENITNSKLSFIGPGREVIDVLDESGRPIGTHKLSGSQYTSIDVSPTYYLSSVDGEFPYGLSNFGSQHGFEFDGVVEPFPIREEIAGLITEKKIKGMKGALAGRYSYNPVRNYSVEITNKINYEDSKIIPYFDVGDNLATEISYDSQLADFANTTFDQQVYSIKRPGIMFIDDRKIDPFIDKEERVIQALPLAGNNPSETGYDEIVNEVFSLNHEDDDNLGAENLRRRSGFDFSSNPHPGTDSIVFGGLKYV